GGYPTYLGHKAAGVYRRAPAMIRSIVARLANTIPASSGKVTFEFMAKQFVRAAELPALERHLHWFGALGPDPQGVALDEVTQILAGFPTSDPLNRILWLDFLTYLPDNLLVKVD